MIHIFLRKPAGTGDRFTSSRTIVRTIEEHDIQRLVIDGVTSYSTALDDQRAYRDFFHALVAYSRFR